MNIAPPCIELQLFDPKSKLSSKSFKLVWTELVTLCLTLAHVWKKQLLLTYTCIKLLRYCNDAVSNNLQISLNLCAVFYLSWCRNLKGIKAFSRNKLLKSDCLTLLIAIKLNCTSLVSLTVAPAEPFLVRIFCIYTEHGNIRTLSIFSTYVGKYGLEKLRIRTYFTQSWRH